LAAIQTKNADGYIGAQQDSKHTSGREIYKQISAGDIRARGEEDLNGLWSPFYVEHKILAGLRDAYRYAGNKNALEVEQKLAAWTEATLAPLSDEQVQRMLKAEFGGMNEVLVDLYADTGDRRWLNLSQKFEDRSMFEPMVAGNDILGGQHANHNIPK